MKGMDKALAIINDIARQYGITGSKRNKNDFLYYEPPEGWEGTLYYFAYTPWKTLDPETGKKGFYTLKYRYLKTTGEWKLVKKCRWGRRKIANKRALTWYENHYGQTPN